MPLSRPQMRSQLKGNRKMPLTKKQKKIARVSPPRNKITRADFKKLKGKKKPAKKKRK